MVATPGRKERRIDFCKSCMAKKSRDGYFAAVDKIEAAHEGKGQQPVVVPVLI
jgi:hypothetical protein